MRVLVLIRIWICPLVFDTPMYSFFTLDIKFESTKNIHVLEVLIWSFGGCCRFLTGVLHLDLDLNMVTGLWLYVLILKVQRTSLSFNFSFWALEDARGC